MNWWHRWWEREERYIFTHFQAASFPLSRHRIYFSTWPTLLVLWYFLSLVYNFVAYKNSFLDSGKLTKSLGSLFLCLHNTWWDLKKIVSKEESQWKFTLQNSSLKYWMLLWRSWKITIITLDIFIKILEIWKNIPM